MDPRPRRPVRRAALIVALLTLGPVPARAQKGAYRAEFNRISEGSGPEVSKSNAFSRTRISGTSTLVTTLEVPSEIPLATAPSGSFASFIGKLDATIKAAASVRGPASSDPNKRFTATLTLTVTDEHPSPARTLCSGTDSRQVAPGAGADLKVDLECFAVQLGLFNGSSCGTTSAVRANVLLTFEGGSASDLLEAQYLTKANWDDITLALASPEAGPLPAGTTQTFSLKAFPQLGTRKDGDLRLFLVDGAFRPLAVSAAKAVTCSDTLTGVPMSVANAVLPSTKTALYLLAVLTAPGTADPIASAYVPYVAEDGLISGLIRRSAGGVDYWLPDAKVELLDKDGNVLTRPGLKTLLGGTSDFPFSRYSIKTSDLLNAAAVKSGSPYSLKVTLQDDSPGAAFDVDTGDGRRDFRWDFTMRAGLNPRMDLDVNSGGGFVAADPERAKRGAEVYWDAWRQLHLMLPLYAPDPFLTRTRTLHFRASDLIEAAYCETRSFRQGCDTPENTLQDTVFFRRALGASPDDLWGQAGLYMSHVLGGTLNDLPIPTDPVLSDRVFGRNFLLFWAASSGRVLAGRPDGEVIVMDVARRLEWNRGIGANLLWDMTDVPVDTEPRTVGSGPVMATDVLSLPLETVVALANETASPPKNLEELVKRAKEVVPGVNEKLSNGLSYLENEVELLRLPDSQARTAGPLALAGSDSEMSLGLEPVTGSYLAVTLVGPDGSPVPATRLDVAYVFGPGYESLNRTESRLVASGNVYFEMPDRHYPVQARLSVAGSDRPPLVIDNAAYWAAVPNSADHFLSHTFVVPSDVPQVDTVTPSVAAGGITVISGRNFSADSVVLFGTEPATVFGPTATALTVRVPATSRGGTVDVSVVRSGKVSNVTSYRVLGPHLTVSPVTLDFGNVAVGQTADRVITLRNEGSAPLTIGSLAFPASYSAVPPSSSLDSGAETSITVRFAPASPVASAATLFVPTNEVGARPVAVALRGTGTGTRPGSPEIAASPEGIAFGTVVVGQNRVATVALRNLGNGPLNVKSAAVSGGAFTLTSPTFPMTLAAGAELPLALKFAPTAPAATLGALLLASDDLDEPTLTIPLAGEGAATGSPAACTYAVSPARLQLGPGASSGTIAVAAPAGCAWSASAAGFVTLGGPSGNGSGSVTYQVAANDTGAARAANVRVAGVTVAVSQGTDGRATTTVPVILTSEGANGSFFTSELVLTNRGESNAVVELAYTAAAGGGSGTATDLVPAKAQLVFPDALEYLRSVGVPIPASGNRVGTLRVTFSGLSTPSAGSATVRTASVVPEGRAGLAYGSVARGAALTGTSYLCGLRQNGDDRANVAVVNAGTAADGEVVVRLTVFSGDPASPTSKVLPDLALPPGGFAQVSGILGSNGLSLGNGWVKVEKVRGAAPYYAYAVINDQKNSDGSFVPPVLAEVLAGKTSQTLPVLVEVSTFASELVLTNFGSAPRSFKVTFVADAVTASGNAASLDFTLAAGEQRILPDFIQVLRDRGVAGIGAKGPTFAGAAFLTVASGDVSGLFIGARTSAPGGGGRYGLFYTGVPAGTAATDVAYLYGLQQNADNRTNVALVNTGEVDGGSDTFQLQVVNGATGQAAATFELTLPAKRWTQVSGVLTQYAPGVANAYVKVTRTAGRNPFLAYAVVNDGGSPGQRSGDGAFITMDISP